MKIPIITTSKIALTLAVCVLCLLTLDRYEYIITFNEIDNVIGAIPIVFSIVCLLGSIYLIWNRYTKQSIPLTVTVVLLIVASILLFPNALQGNWWINPTQSSKGQDKPDLTVYIPFSSNSQTAKLSTPASLKLTQPLPIIDGATALYPLYAAFAETVYEQALFQENMVLCTNTSGAYNALISNKRDIIFVATASERQKAAALEKGVDLVFTPIGREAFVFIVGKENPINNISQQQLKNIYSGKTAYWHTLGWEDGGKIIAFQRPDGSGSQTGLQSIVMRDLPIQVPQPLPSPTLIGANSLMKQVSVEWNGIQPALGYSYRYYATTMYGNDDTKLLSINDVYPSIENIQNGTYPFVGDFYAVTRGEPNVNSKLFIDWILSEQGQKIIEKTGYTPIK